MARTDLSTLGSLRVRRVVTPGVNPGNDESKPPLTVVLLHGFGAPGDDLVALAQALRAPPGTRFVFPEAPIAFPEVRGDLFDPGRAWWMIDIAAIERAASRGEIRDLTGEVPEGLAPARAALVSMLDALARETGDAGRVVLGGFSQGAMLALDVALHDPRPIAGIVLLSGTFLSENEWRPRMPSRKGTRVFQSHGSMDPVLPFSIAARLRDALGAAGLDVTFAPFDDGHTIPGETLDLLGEWLGAIDA